MLNSKNFLPLTIAKEDTKYPIRSGLHVTPDHTEATDGYRLIRVSRPKVNLDDEPETVKPLAKRADYVMPLELAKKISKALPKKLSLPAFENDNAGDAVSFSVTDLETVDKFSGKKIAGAYPDVAQIMPAPADHVADVLVDCGYLSEILDACKKFGSPLARITFNGAIKPLTITAQDEVDGQTFLALLMPCK